MVAIRDELVEAAMEELEHTPVIKTLWESEAVYLDGIRHALGDEYLPQQRAMLTREDGGRCHVRDSWLVLFEIKRSAANPRYHHNAHG